MAPAAFLPAAGAAALRRRRCAAPPPRAPRLAPRRAPRLSSRPAGAGAGAGAGRTVLVTGSTDGIGLHTAKTLAARGWRVFVHGRRRERTAAALRAVRAAGGAAAPAPRAVVADLSRAADVRALAGEVAALAAPHGGLDVLVNNAGVFEAERAVADGGTEMTLAVNVLAPFLLCGLLRPAMERAGGRRAAGRIVNVSSISHRDGGRTRPGGTIDWDDLQSGAAPYDAHAAYGLSKLLILMLSYTMSGMDGGVAGEFGSTVVALDPGTVNTKMLRAGWGACGVAVDAAGDEAWCAASGEVVNGSYYVGRRASTSAALSYDGGARVKVWRAVERLVGAWDRPQ